MSNAKRTIGKAVLFKHPTIGWGWTLTTKVLHLKSNHGYKTQGGALKMLRATAKRLNIRIPFIGGTGVLRW